MRFFASFSMALCVICGLIALADAIYSMVLFLLT